MNDKLKSTLTAGGVIVAVGAGLLGFKLRQNADLGGGEASLQSARFGQMLASRSNDVNIPAGKYFYDLSEQLKQNYVEPVTDDEKLAAGAIRGMISSLGDPDSIYYDKNVFPVFANEKAGKFEGVGADLELTFASKVKPVATAPQPEEGGETPEDAIDAVREIPKVLVASVVPGGPADRAGVKAGDTVYAVDGHWVVQSDLIKKFRAAARKYAEKKMTLPQLNLLRNDIKKKFDRAVFPAKARDRLIAGHSGEVTVVWERAGVQRSTKIQKGFSQMPAFSVKGNVVCLPFTANSAEQLKSAIRGKHDITLDLRNNTLGDDKSMKECLAVVAPKGGYGYLTNHRSEAPISLNVLSGNPNPPKLNLLVDQSTRGPAEAFALALSSRGRATLSSPKMGGDPVISQVVKLSDGSGYTLLTSIYSQKAGGTRLAKKGGAR